MSPTTLSAESPGTFFGILLGPTGGYLITNVFVSIIRNSSFRFAKRPEGESPNCSCCGRELPPKMELRKTENKFVASCEIVGSLAREAVTAHLGVLLLSAFMWVGHSGGAL